ncbi:MAG: hypothetical protein A2857_03485 [Candidatus Levybacteria bacterium RIFCSPHIGHO2_01_FULL_36_15]|nr:MAG: hypothetical protein A2857_03485 [Candidatus Levybacteria bacterium RIFCSPHIGHO2_01_FULL_36_15]OGH37880.1 MAG: hypothetical protein A2905_02175 [Candidatus Levybacteria bacterium RIFCSPLOWO2_01_FULL_36_10]
MKRFISRLKKIFLVLGTHVPIKSLDNQLKKSIKKHGKFIIITSDKNHAKEFHLEQRKIYLIVDGRAFLSCIEEDGKKIIFDIIGEGSILGNLDFLKAEVSSNECMFIEPFPRSTLKLYEITRENFLKVLYDYPDFVFHVLSDLSERIFRLEKKIEELVFSRLKVRILYVLIQLGQPTDERYLKVDVKITHEKLAESTGAARETVSRALSELQKDGFIFYDKKRNIIVDLEEKQKDRYRFLDTSYF